MRYFKSERGQGHGKDVDERRVQRRETLGRRWASKGGLAFKAQEVAEGSSQHHVY